MLILSFPSAPCRHCRGAVWQAAQRHLWHLLLASLDCNHKSEWPTLLPLYGQLSSLVVSGQKTLTCHHLKVVQENDEALQELSQLLAKSWHEALLHMPFSNRWPFVASRHNTPRSESYTCRCPKHNPSPTSCLVICSLVPDQEVHKQAKLCRLHIFYFLVYVT